MATSSRTSDPGLIRQPVREALEDEPFRFQFFQAVRLLEQFSPQRNPVGRFVHPSTEVVRFSARQSLTFPPSEVHSIEREGSGPSCMKVNFMGLTGPQGELPLVYTEFVMERAQKRDTALADFLDIFNHRMISLFYRAWEKYHFAATYRLGERDRISRVFADLVGIGTGGLQRRLEPDVADESLLFYTGLLAQRPHSTIALEQIVADYFAVPVTVEQFVGAWYRLERDSQTCFTESDRLCESLGIGTVLGDAIWDQQSLARIRIGPLSLDEYVAFLPTGRAHKSLKSLVRFYCDELDFEVQLVLRRGEAPRVELGTEGKSGPQLGWVSWMKSFPLQADPGDTVLRL